MTVLPVAMLAVTLFVAACGQLKTVGGLGVLGSPQKSAPNIILIIGDDMGVETLASYGLGKNPPKTAALNELARRGVRFNNFWSQPVCSPTRATLMTGRYGFRTGIGRPVGGSKMPTPPAKPAGSPPESTDHTSVSYTHLTLPTTPYV